VLAPGAITADPLGVLIAFGAGILSFLSPCVLPLVPGYLSMVSGLSATELATARRHPAEPAHQALERREVLVGAGPGPSSPTTAAGPVAAPQAPGRSLVPLVRGMLLFVGGFTLVFVALGAAASGLGHLLRFHKEELTTVAGAVIVVLGTILLASSLPAGVWARLGSRVSGRAAWLVGERRFHVRPEAFGAWAAPLMGMAFAFAWTPCIGPVLAAVLGLAELRSTLAGGVLLLFAYSLGLGVPFVVTGFAFDRLTAFYGRARRHLALVQVVAAAVLIAFGALLVAGDLGWLSAQFSSLLDHLGLHRLTTS